MNKKYIPWILFALVSSPLLLMPLFIMDQYDIIALFFILLGILMYIRGKFKWFLLFFAIAIPIKFFAIFIFIPLLVLNNKKILQIIKYLAIGVAPMLVVRLISSFMPMYSESTKSFNGFMMSKLFSAGIGVNFGSASLFCIALVAITIFCYMKNIKNKTELGKYAIYIPLLVLSSFFAFVSFHPQWAILITPFIAITLFQNMRLHKINVLIDLMISACFMAITVFVYYWCYGPLVIERMIIPKLFGSTHGMALKYPFVSDLLAKVSGFLPLFLAAFVVGLAALLIINYPKADKLGDKLVKHDIEWGLLFTKMLVIVPVPILMVICYYWIS